MTSPDTAPELGTLTLDMWPLQLLLSLCVPALAALGWPFLRMWTRKKSVSLDKSTAFAASLALGLVLMQAGGMILGFTGGLTKIPVVLWIACSFGAALAIWWREGRPSPELPRISLPGLITATIALGYLLMATVPPWYRDEVIYHLALPRSFAMDGGYTQPDDNIFASLPLGWESILALLHALGPSPDYFPPLNPRLVGAWTHIGAALTCSGLAAFLGASSSFAPWASVLLLLIPTVAQFGPSAYVEPYLMLSSTLALYSAIRSTAGARSFVAPAAIFAGVAASTKYTGIAVCLFIWALLLFNALRRSRDERGLELRAAHLFLGVATVVACPFYIRNILERGNPIFPLLYDVFGGRGWDARRALAYEATLARYGVGRGVMDYILLPFRFSTTRSFSRGFEGSVGPVVGLSFLTAVRSFLSRSGRLQRPKIMASGFALLWSVFWAASVQQARFYLVALPALLALLVAAVEDVPMRLQRAPAWILRGILLGSLVWFLPLAWELWNQQRTSEWLGRQIGRDELLSTMLPESYPLEPELESFVPPHGRVWLVWMRGDTYYLRRKYRLDMVFGADRFEELLALSRDTRIAQAKLHDDGISHLLIQHRFFLEQGTAELRPGRTELLRMRFKAMLDAQALRCLRQWGTVALYEVAP